MSGYRADLTTHEDWELLLHLVAEGEQALFVPVVTERYYIKQVSMAQIIDVDHQRFRRMFDQRRLGLPRALPTRRMYHPAIDGF